MAKSIVLRYYKNKRGYNLEITDDGAGYEKLKDFIYNVKFALSYNKVARENVDKLIMFCDENYCAPGQIIDNLMTDLFCYQGEQLKKLINLLLDEKTSVKTFYELEII